MDLVRKRFTNTKLGISVTALKDRDTRRIYFIGEEIADVIGYSNPANAVKRIVDNPIVSCSKKLPETADDIIYFGGPFHDPDSDLYSITTYIDVSAVYKFGRGWKSKHVYRFKKWLKEDILPVMYKERVCSSNTIH